LQSSGKIGIGGTPAQTFHITSTADAGNLVLAENTNAVGTGANGQLRAAGDTAILGVIGHGTGRTLTRYGITLGGYTEIFSSAGNGLIIGTSGIAKPVVFGTNNVERMRIFSSGGISIGNTTDPGAANLYVTGTLGLGTTVVANHFIEESGSLNGVLIGLKETNTSNGAGAYASIQLANDTGNLFAFFLNSSGNTAYGGAQGVTMSQVGNFPMSFATQDTVRWGINGAGDWTFGASGHIADSNGTPTVASGFGSSPSPSIVGADYGMIVTIGGGLSTGGIINFGHTFTNAPVCVALGGVAIAGINIGSSTTQVGVAWTNADYSGVTLHILCRGY
jgi:hypothetical protein